ncbi:hypothetical protein BsWGS_16932 [Bradybaena similaris]
MFTITSTVPASAFEGSISITGKAELAGNITIICSWTVSVNEGLLGLRVQTPNNEPEDKNQYYYYFHPAYSYGLPGNQHHNRMTYERFNFVDLRFIVRITNLQYSDEKNYSCYFQYGSPDTLVRKYTTTSYLAVKARSSTLTIILTPRNVTGIKESSIVSAFCATNVCQLGRGIIQWKIYRRGVLDVIEATDSRLDEMKRVDLLPAEDKCTHHIEQTFKIQVTSAEQNLVIACFVQIDGGQTPDECRYPATDLCNKTDEITIEVTKPESRSADGWQAYGLLFIASFCALLLAIAAAVLLLVYLQKQKAEPPPPPPTPKRESVKKKEPVEEPADEASEISEGESSGDFEAGSQV